MGGIPIDEATWKAILEETDTNKDGKVILFYFLFKYNFIKKKFEDFNGRIFRIIDEKI